MTRRKPAPPDPSTLRAAVLAHPADLSHAEVHRRVTSAGYATSLGTVAGIRREAHGPREAGRQPGAERLLLATLVDQAAQLGVTPGEIVAAGVESIGRRR